MTTIQSKFAKSLQIHNLENLVFQKRERKTVQQSFLIHQAKNKHKKQKRQQNSQKAKKQNQESSENEHCKLQKKKTILKLNKLKYKRNPQFVKPVSSKNKKEQVQHKTINLPLKVESKRNSLTAKQRVSGFAYKRPRKSLKRQIKSEVEKLSFSLKNFKKIQENQSIQIEKKKVGRPHKIIEEVNRNIQNPQSQLNATKQIKTPIKCRALINLMSADSKKPVKESQSPIQPRQAKLNALKKYSQKQFFPDNSSEHDKAFTSKKKKIFKFSEVSNYSLNRIFRKEAKVELSPIDLEVKIDQLSLNSFSQKFGTFDAIHSSLPLSMIWQMPEIQNLMIKGFIFIWVEKGQISLAYHLLNRLGYDVIDQIVWIKSDEGTKTVFNEALTQDELFFNQQNLFLNSKSVCFIGYKCPLGQKAQYRTKISNNLIFAKPSLQHPLKKPDQIYQIVQLLMPGSKKLQLGGYQKNGWVSLHHHETRLRKCAKCLAELSTSNFQGILVKQANLFKNQNANTIGSICELCQRGRLDSKQGIDEEKISQRQFTENQFVAIQTISYLDQSDFKQCSNCSRQADELIACYCQKLMFLLYCKRCFEKQFSNHLSHRVEIKVKRKVFLNTAKLHCSTCQKKTLSSHYYECIAYACRYKNHLCCQSCFWKAGYENIENQHQFIDSKKKNDASYHEWKLKIITSQPYERSLCSSCKHELLLPYFVCQTCVGWRWCGKCKLSQRQQSVHEIPSEKQSLFLSQLHKLSLIY